MSKRKTEIPDFRKMLPSEARRALTDFFYKMIWCSGLTYRASPNINAAQAFAHINHCEWTRNTIAMACWEKAHDRFSKRHPLAMDGNRTHRQGYPSTASVDELPDLFEIHEVMFQ